MDGVNLTPYLGFDVGIGGDPSGLVAVTVADGVYRLVYSLEIRSRSFGDQLARVGIVANRLRSTGSNKRTQLIYDASGIGCGIGELAGSLGMDSADLIGYTITGGSSLGGRTVSKTRLLSGLQTVIRTGRLRIPDRPETVKIRRQLQTWQIETDGTTMKAVKDRQGKHHYDLAIALSLVIVHHERRSEIF